MNVNVCQSLFGMLVVEVQFGLCRACSPSNSPAQPSTHPLAVPFTGFPEELPIVKAGNVARAIRKYLPAGAPPRKQTEEWVPFPFPFPFVLFSFVWDWRACDGFFADAPASPFLIQNRTKTVPTFERKEV